MWGAHNAGARAATGSVATPTPAPATGQQPGAPAPTEVPQQPSSQATQPAQQPQEAPTPTSEANRGQQIAAAGALPVGQAMEFTLPTGEPAVLAHNDSGYSAYVAICTHQGCQVQPMGSGIVGCPCHGAEFDTASQGQVVRGPAMRPLSSIPVTVDSAGNVYLAS